MWELLSLLFCFFKASLSGQSNLALENLALRQQLVILKRTQKRPVISTKDRLFWVWLSRIWSEWRAPLLIVKPATIIGWHRKGFRLFWTRLSRRKIGGRPSANSQIRALIKQIMKTQSTIPFRFAALSYTICGICPHRPAHNSHNVRKRYKFLSGF